MSHSKAKSSSEIDRHVGARMRLRRMAIGLSQTKLGEALGVTSQQIQEYEEGLDRIGAARLATTARILGVPITYFFESPDGRVISAPV